MKLTCDIITSDQMVYKRIHLTLTPRTFSLDKCIFSNMVYISLFTSPFILLDIALNKIYKILMLI